MEKKFLMKRQNERLNVPSSKKGSDKRWCYGGRDRADVGRLANLARGFVLPVFVGVN